MEREQADGRLPCEPVETASAGRRIPRRGAEVKVYQRLARDRLMGSMPEILDSFADAARQGSIPHAKALTAIGGIEDAVWKAPPPTAAAAGRRPQSLAALLRKELKRGTPAGPE